MKRKKYILYVLFIAVLLVVSVFVVKKCDSLIFKSYKNNSYESLNPESDFVDIKVSQYQQSILDSLGINGLVGKIKILMNVDGSYEKAKLKRDANKFDTVDVSYEQSYKVGLSKTSKYKKFARKFKLINIDKETPTTIAVNKLANSYGLICPRGDVKMLRVNDEVQGAYYFVEDLGKEYLEREKGITLYSKLTGRSKKNNFNAVPPETNILRFYENPYLQNLKIKNSFYDSLAVNEYLDLCKAVQEKQYGLVKAVIDSDYISKYIAFSLMVDDNQWEKGKNMNFVYDFSRSKFYPVFKSKIKKNNSRKISNSINTKLFKLLMSDREIVESVNNLISEPDDLFKNSVFQQKFKESRNVLTSVGITSGQIDKEQNYLMSIFQSVTERSKALLTINDSLKSNIKDETLKFLKVNNIKFSLIGNQIIVKKGVYNINSDVIISSRFATVFSKGVVLNLGEKINFSIQGDLSIQGTIKDSVKINNMSPHSEYATFSVVGHDSTFVDIKFLKVSGGSSSYFGGQVFSGQFAVYNSNVTIKNSVFEKSRGDDGLNLKYCKFLIENCVFRNNYADQVDLDFCVGTVTNSQFSPSYIDGNGDGLDLSGSYVKVNKCHFSNFLDKGLSIGEKSKALVCDSYFVSNENAIAIKDESQLFSWENNFKKNNLNYYAYIKKKVFDDPKVFIQKVDSQDKVFLSKSEPFELSNEKVKYERKKFKERNDTYFATGELLNRPFD